MKLRRVCAAVLALVLAIGASPFHGVQAAEDTLISAPDTNYVLRSAAIKYVEGNAFVERGVTDGVNADDPMIDTLLTQAPGQFNKSGEEWLWIAYKISAPADGTYRLGVAVNNARDDQFKMPMVINHGVYTLSFTAKKQTVTTEVVLPAGEHIVTVFWPMPATASEALDADWKNYIWANVQTLVVDAQLTVCAAPTAAQVEASFAPQVKEDAVISAVDTDKLLLSATIQQNPTALGRTDQSIIGADQPTVETLYAVAKNQFNQSGQEWNWFAYKVQAVAAGTYTLGVKTAGSKYASYQLPLCVGGKVYPLHYTAKAQEVTVDVELPKGEHVVVMFMPMPAAKANMQNNVWNDYHWCDVESVKVDGSLTVSKPTVAEVEACFALAVISAVDTDKLLLSATIQQNPTALGRTDQATIGADQPTVETLYAEAYGQFNKSGEEWNWFAYKLKAAAEGDYTLGVKTANAKYNSFAIPLCVNGKAHTLQFTAKAQKVTADIHLPAGEHVVVMFMPMPVNQADVENNVWNDYLWCDIEGVIVDTAVQISKPTVAQVEACFPQPEAVSPLQGQSALFVGDGITGAKDSWASKIGTAYDMDWTNSGVTGATISDLQDKIIRHQLMICAGKTYDYVILQGGIHDADAPVGAVSDSWNVADFDTATYVGALETLFYYAYENFGGAKLGYIFNYATPNADASKWKGAEDLSAYFAEGKKVCEKWGISCMDLYSGSTEDGKSYSYDILQVDSNAANFLNSDPHEIHLSNQGYEAITPYIAQWMETLTENASPVPAANAGKHIDANDGNKVLFGGFTARKEYANGAALAGLQDRVYTAMAEDKATIELLPYAKDLLGDWAFASIAVEAAEDGQYTFLAEMSAKVAYQMGMLVDGEAYTLNYTKQNGHYQFVEQTVSLTKGTHYITVTAAMPKNDIQLNGDAWNLYPWTNLSAFVLDEGLQILSKPALEDVTAKLGARDSGFIRVEAENAEYVLYNNYNTPNEKNNAASGGMVVGGAWNSTHQQTFAQLESWLNIKGNAYVEYAVEAPADGEYEIAVGFLAGSNDKTIEKPYIAVIVNETTYKAQFTAGWNQVDKVKLTVSLKKGLNIIRCTSMTTDQPVYTVKGWINQDFLEVSSALTPVKRSEPVILEAETSKVVNRLKVQAGAEGEEASGNVLGSSDRKYVTSQRLTLNQLTRVTLRQVPYFSFTVNAPQDGYYPIRVAMATDGRLKNATIGMVVDGKMHAVEYARTDKTTKGAMVDTLVYLTAGDHVLTFTTPMPAKADPAANYSYYWCNYDYVMLYDGLTLAKQQKSPVDSFARIEVEEHAMFNFNSNNGTAAGNAYYRSSQSIDQMLENGIDGGKTPYVELTVHAQKAGSYTLYLGVTSGMTAGSTRSEVYTRFVAEVNGELLTKSVKATKNTVYTIIPLSVQLKEGSNTIRLTHLSSDAHFGGTTWIDYDFIEIPAWQSPQLCFEKGGETLEAETAKYEGFGENLSDSYSGGRYLGRANYDTVQEVNVTFDNMDPANLNGLPNVTYRVFAEKAGVYPVSVGFAAGLTNYTTEETQQGVDASLVAIVNGQSKQRVTFTLTSPSAHMTRIVWLELKEGENEVTFTGTTTEYVVDRIPRNEETYRLVWIDHDFLALSSQLSNLGQEAEPFDVEDSGYDYPQLVPREPSKVPSEPQPGGESGLDISILLWIAAAVAAAAALIILILIFGKKRKKN